jgi:hypothetical protein
MLVNREALLLGTVAVAGLMFFYLFLSIPYGNLKISKNESCPT